MDKATSRRRRIGTALAILLIIAMLLIGTFAVILPSQHGSNVFKGNGDPEVPSVKLVDTFNPAHALNWRAPNPINKNVTVLNDGDVPAFVKMQFKEYMDITDEIGTSFKYWQINPGNPSNPASVTESQGPNLFAIESDPIKGDVFVVYSAPKDANVATVKTYFESLGYVANDVAHFTELVNGQTGWFVVTEAGDRNGQYGRYAYAEVLSTEDGDTTVIGNASKATCYHYNVHDDDHLCQECLYDVRTWDASGGIGSTSEAFMTYVEWLLGDDVIYMADWLVGGTTLGGDPVAAKSAGEFWIIGDDGWIYWGIALPSGVSTSAFMEHVKLLIQPEGKFDYVIHIDMEACTDPRADWPGEDEDILDAWQPISGKKYKLIPYVMEIRSILEEYLYEYPDYEESNIIRAELNELLNSIWMTIEEMEADGVDAAYIQELKEFHQELYETFAISDFLTSPPMKENIIYLWIDVALAPPDGYPPNGILYILKEVEDLIY